MSQVEVKTIGFCCYSLKGQQDCCFREKKLSTLMKKSHVEMQIQIGVPKDLRVYGEMQKISTLTVSSSPTSFL